MDFSTQSYEEPSSAYTDATRRRLIILYGIATIFWTVFYYFIGAFGRPQLFYKFAFFIPIIIFGITVYFLKTVTVQSEQILFKTNFLSIGLIIFFPIFSTIMTKYRGDTSFFISLMVGGFIFSLISLYDIWVDPEYQPIIKHTKTILQTFAITLIIVAMYTFYINETDPELIKKNMTTPLV